MLHYEQHLVYNRANIITNHTRGTCVHRTVTWWYFLLLSKIFV